MLKKIAKYTDKSLLIYQMGKVGSSSLEASLPNGVQVHDFYYNPPCYVHRKIAYSGVWKYCLHRSSLIFKRNLYRFRKEVKIITLIREPVSRNISMFFQSLPYWVIEYQTGIATNGVGVGARYEGDEFLQQCFQSVFPHDYPSDWFDVEFYKFTGIDVYAQSYDKDVGYKTYKNGRYNVLLIDMKRLNELSNVVSEFVGQEVVLQDKNKATNKWYAPFYPAFKKAIASDEAYNRKMESTKYYQHFYGG